MKMILLEFRLFHSGIKTWMNTDEGAIHLAVEIVIRMYRATLVYMSLPFQPVAAKDSSNLDTEPWLLQHAALKCKTFHKKVIVEFEIDFHISHFLSFLSFSIFQKYGKVHIHVCIFNAFDQHVNKRKWPTLMFVKYSRTSTSNHPSLH